MLSTGQIFNASSGHGFSSANSSCLVAGTSPMATNGHRLWALRFSFRRAILNGLTVETFAEGRIEIPRREAEKWQSSNGHYAPLLIVRDDEIAAKLRRDGQADLVDLLYQKLRVCDLSRRRS
jgi:hypothetical protein